MLFQCEFGCMGEPKHLVTNFNTTHIEGHICRQLSKSMKNLRSFGTSKGWPDVDLGFAP